MASRQASHMKNRRTLGLCREGGCKEASGDSVLCPLHAERHRVTRKLSYHRRKLAQGVK